MSILVKSFGTRQTVSLQEMLDKKLTTRYRIGCDSLNLKNKTVYITTIVGFHPNNRGAFIYYIKETVPLIRDTYKRLWMEVEKSIAFASRVKSDHNIQVEAIDFDLNSKEKHISSRFASSAISYANSCGFEAFCKPDTLLAVYAADYISHGGTGKEKKKNADV
jgi:predicted RNase H-related nuclease YkuK (DUF458 family)